MRECRSPTTERYRLSWSLVLAAGVHGALLGLGTIPLSLPPSEQEDPSTRTIPIDIAVPRASEAPALRGGAPPGGDGLPGLDREHMGLPDTAGTATPRSPVAPTSQPAARKASAAHVHKVAVIHDHAEDGHDDHPQGDRDAGSPLEAGGSRHPGARQDAADGGSVASADHSDARDAGAAPFSIVALLESRVGSKYGYASGDSGVTGPGGSHGGPGGWGAGRGWGAEKLAAAPIIAAPNVFGSGTSGAFTGIVCAIPPGTASLGAIRDCGQPLGKLFTNQINVPPRKFTEGFPGLSGRTEWFAIEYRGTIRATREGKYIFRVLSDDGARLVIDSEMVVDNDGQHGPTSRWGETWLPVATHSIRIDYYQGPRWDIALQVFVTPPGGQERLLGPVL